MPERLKLYLDQMLRLDVAQTLRSEGHDVVLLQRLVNKGQMTSRYCKKQLTKIEYLLL